MKIKINDTWLNHLLNFLGVIIGVYLGFYINEKAQERGERKEALILMNSIINDLSADIKNYETYQIPVNVTCQANIDSLLSLITMNRVEELNDQLGVIFQVENYSPASSTYNSMKSSGKIRLIENLNLQKKLSDYYDGLVLECEAKNKIQVDFFMNELISWLITHADLTEMKILDEEALLVLSNKLIIYSSLVNQKVENYKLLVEESRQLKEQLESLTQVK